MKLKMYSLTLIVIVMHNEVRTEQVVSFNTQQKSTNAQG